jgi:hypothetical protein
MMSRRILVLIFFFSFLSLAYSENIHKETTSFSTLPEAHQKFNANEGVLNSEEFFDSTYTTQKGLFSVYNKDDKWYLEITDSFLNRDILTITRYSKLAPMSPVYLGEESNNQVIRFEKGNGNKMFMKATVFSVVRPDSSETLFNAIENSNEPPILESFDIVAVNKDTHTGAINYIIEVSPFFLSDKLTFMSRPTRRKLGLGGIMSSESYIEEIKAFPNNMQVKVVKTYSSSASTPIVIAQLVGTMTIEFNTTIILLPEKPLRVRKSDLRIGYFNTSFNYYSDSLQKADIVTSIQRWRLEPKNLNDLERQKRGELIEPKDPIIFYIDPATPNQWKPYFKSGVDKWQPAFEAAGWKNAVRAEYWHEADSSGGFDDTRFSTIRYLPSSIENAHGHSIIDPRSGEIIQATVLWHHNMMNTLHDWYFIQAGAVDPNARNRVYSDTLMGKLVEEIISHEVGHTLGLTHNMGASARIPVEKLRDKEYIQKYGHSSSIMDYTRFNYVAQPEDSIKDLIPRIGEYDIWAIKYGYSYLSEVSPEEENKILNDWIVDAYKNPMLHFGTDGSKDPRNQMEDLGDNAVTASVYGIKNLKRIVPNLIRWNYLEGDDYKETKRLYAAAVEQFKQYIGHVIAYIGASYENPVTYDMEGSRFENVPVERQAEAVFFLNEYLFKSPLWLADPELIKYFSETSASEFVSIWQKSALDKLFEGKRLLNLVDNNYSLQSLLNDLEPGIFTELHSKTQADMYARNLQSLYINKLSGIIDSSSKDYPKIENTDVVPVIKSYLEILAKELNKSSKSSSDRINKYHYIELVSTINDVL